MFLELGKVFLPVTRLEESAKWYTDRLGISPGLQAKLRYGRAMELSCATNSFWLVERSELNRLRHIPFNFHIDDIEGLHASLAESGAPLTELIDEPVGSGSIRCCDFCDPEGNRLGLVRDGYAPSPSLDVGVTFLGVSDLGRAASWYAEKLGYSFTYYDVTGGAGIIGPTLEYMPEVTVRYAAAASASFRVPQTRVMLVEIPEPAQPKMAPYTLLSADAEADRKQLSDKGVVCSPMDWSSPAPAFSFLDTDGNEIGVEQRT